MKRILILMPSLIGGGAERTLINLLSRIDHEKYAVDLALVSNKGIFLDQVPEQVNVIPLFERDIVVRAMAYLQRKFSFDLFFKMVVKSKLTKSYDVGFSFLDSSFTDLLFFVENLQKKGTWVHASYRTNQNYYQFFKKERYRDKIKSKRYDRLDFLVFVSKDSKNEFESIFGVFPNSQVILNLINADMVRSKANLAEVDRSGKFHFLAMGNLIKVKGFDRLIQSARLLKDKGLDFKIQIAGKGPEDQNLKNLIRELDLTEEVELIGFQLNPYPFLKACDAFVMSSISEALPTVICEAMILGKPVVSTACSGAKELLSNGQFGMLAEHNAEDLAEKMELLIRYPDQIEKYAALSKKRSRIFDDEKVLEDYYKIFDM